MEPPTPLNRIEIADEIFSEALELPLDQRTGFVRARCSSDGALCESVLNLLSGYNRLGDFLQTPAVGSEPTAAAFSPGEILGGRFRIVSLIGRGGMGEVYRADDSLSAQTVALKVLHPRMRGDESMAVRLRDEILLARKISHPSICRVNELFVESHGRERLVYFTMQFLDGVTLAERLSQGAFDPRTALSLARQIAAGLDAAHDAGIMHRDLKPANIVLVKEKDGSDRAVIMDFGLARAFDTEANTTSETFSGQIAGTPEYMSPEQFLGGDLTPGVDVFAFAVVFWEMIAGRPAFPRENIVRSAVRRMVEPPPPLSRYGPAAPQTWDAILTRAMAAHPASRYQSAGAMIEALDAATRPSTLPGVSRRALLYSVAGATGMACIGGFLRYRDWRPALPAKPLLMLTPITSAMDSTAGPSATNALNALLTNQLQQSAHVRVMPREQIEAALRRIDGVSQSVPTRLDPSKARDAAMREGANFVVFGNLSQVADERVLQLRLQLMGNDPGHARKEWRRDFPVQTENDLPSAVYEGVGWVRQTVGESPTEIVSRSRRPEELTTSSWHALQEFTQANDAWRAGETDAAILHLKTALDLDPDFAMASARMADILIALGRRDEGLPFYGKAADSIRRKNLTDAESLRIRGLFALDSGQNEEAARVFARYALGYPEDGLPLFYQAAAVDRMGQHEQALQLCGAAVERSPESAPFLLTLAGRQLESGKIDAAEATCERAARLHPTDRADQLRAAMAFGRIDPKNCWLSLERMRTEGAPTDQSKAFSLEACFRAEQERWAEAESKLSEGLDHDLRMGLNNAPAFDKRRLIAQLMLRQGRRAEASRICRDLLKAKPGAEDAMLIGCLLAQAGDVRTAQSCLPKALPQWPCYQHWIDRLNGEIALAQGRPSEALRRMISAPPPRRNEWREYAARAANAAKDRDAVRELIGPLLQNPGWYWFQADSVGPGFLSWAISVADSGVFRKDELGPAMALRNALLNFS
jgi:serine/threonine protein kinase/tetratricopeptide (TPR) repeat protein